MGFVLGRDPDAADAGIDGVGKREIDDAGFAAKKHGGLGAPVRKFQQPAAAPAGQNIGKRGTSERSARHV